MSNHGRLSHGERKRREILRTALDLGSEGGLEALSIGRLAEAAGMSRSGLFAHFGSKQGLQLATIAAAQMDFERQVLTPARAAEPGFERLRVLFESWLGYVEDIPFRGGCFFAMTTSEYGSRDGAVHDLLAQLSLSWVRDLLQEARTAKRQGELRKSADPEQIVFRLHAFMQEANWARELFGDDRAFERARGAAEDTLESNRAPTPNEA
jgi:AcrR family transcriptional regulator